MTNIPDPQVADLQATVNEATDLLAASRVLIDADVRDPSRWREAVLELQDAVLARLNAASSILDRLEEVAA